VRRRIRSAPPGGDDMHWSLPDPAASNDSGQARYTQFRSVANEIDTRIQYLLPALAHHTSADEE
jgi:ArsR family transcriptional regulator, arsenate/arsenite/antimonite-responsive transcriptional repressor / arsenate reductase (thioredoxin)